MIPFLSEAPTLTGISGLLTDPSYFGGGLQVHTDFNHLTRYNLVRRLNLLLTPRGIERMSIVRNSLRAAKQLVGGENVSSIWEQ
jgi:hypothetical protein